jgi:hypothetical protein
MLKIKVKRKRRNRERKSREGMEAKEEERNLTADKLHSRALTIQEAKPTVNNYKITEPQGHVVLMLN